MYTIVIETLTPLSRTSCIKMYKNDARSRLFGRIAIRSISNSEDIYLIDVSGVHEICNTEKTSM